MGQNMKTATAIFVAIPLLSGCSTALKSPTVAAPTTMQLTKAVGPGKTSVELGEEDRMKLENSLSEVLTYCQPRLSGYETDAAKKSKMAFWLSMSGLVAGSVLAPALTSANAAANAPWISGLSGWAGATNFAGQSLKSSGLSGTTIAQTRNDIIRDLRVQIEIAADGAKTFDERRNALMRARAACTVYEIAVPAIPDAG